MSESIEISQDERKVLERALDRFEQSACNWRRRAYLPFTLSILSILFGIYESSNLISLLRPSAKADFIKRIEEIEVPEATPSDYWFVGELRRSVWYFETRNDLMVIQSCLATMGILLFVAGVFGVATTRNRAIDARRDIVLARIARTLMESSSISPD